MVFTNKFVFNFHLMRNVMVDDDCRKYVMVKNGYRKLVMIVRDMISRYVILKEVCREL